LHGGLDEVTIYVQTGSKTTGKRLFTAGESGGSLNDSGAGLARQAEDFGG
jgi:hypothetical protein